MPCKRKDVIHPFGIILICLGCAIVVLVQNKALAKGAEEQKEKDKQEKENPQGGDQGMGWIDRFVVYLNDILLKGGDAPAEEGGDEPAEPAEEEEA